MSFSAHQNPERVLFQLIIRTPATEVACLSPRADEPFGQPLGCGTLCIKVLSEMTALHRGIGSLPASILGFVLVPSLVFVANWSNAWYLLRAQQLCPLFTSRVLPSCGQVKCGMSGSPWEASALWAWKSVGTPHLQSGCAEPRRRRRGWGTLSSVFTAGVLTTTGLWAGSS